MRLDCIERRFSRLFSQHISVVNSQPAPFLLIPIFVTAFLGVGLTRHSSAFLKDELELYTPSDARARWELRELDRLFYINDTDPFYASRRYDIKRTGYIIVTGEQEDEDILNPAVLSAAMHLWSVIQSMTVELNNERQNYPSMCVRFPMPAEFGNTLGMFLAGNNSSDQICVSNPIVEMFKFMLKSDISILNRTLDEMILSQIGEALSLNSGGLSQFLGGVSLDNERKISGAKAMLLPYALRHGTKNEDNLAEKWELQLVDRLLAFNSPLIRASWWTYETLAAESARDRNQLIRMLFPCFVVVSLYTIAMCCCRSWVFSRPIFAVGGVINAAMAIISAVGLLLLLGFKISSIAYSMPFIVFSVGVDNVFILLAAWRITNPNHSLDERLYEAFGDAAVSITVTSLTDFISFVVGCFTPFPSVQMFCIYAVVAVVFTYIYQLTFFAAIMVCTCRREAAGMHCLTMKKIEEKTTPNIYSSPLKLPPPRYSPTLKTSQRQAENSNSSVANFFRTTYTDFLLNPFVKLVIVISFVMYLVAAIYGCANLQIGLEPNDLLPDNSYGKRTLRIAGKYFSEHGSHLHVWMYDLSRARIGYRRIWTVLLDEIQLYEHTEFTGESDCWLRAFYEYVDKAGFDLNATSFIPLLRDGFLSRPQFSKYKRDIRFTPNQTLLDASRVPVQLRFVGSTNQSRAMHLFRRLAETSELPTNVYADFFQFAEQYNAVLPGTLSSIAIAAAAVIAVSLMLIPEPVAALWVTLSIVSINLGVLGFMTYCSVRLDFISMVTIVMSIGLCVDFAAHLAYHYAKHADSNSAERVRMALYSVGLPILQSASSTMLGVSFMSSTESYVFRSFLKTIFLVLTLGVLHGIVILPVLLTVFSCDNKGKSETNEPDATTSYPRLSIYTPTILPRIDVKTLSRMGSFNRSKTREVMNISAPIQPVYLRSPTSSSISRSSLSSDASELDQMKFFCTD